MKPSTIGCGLDLCTHHSQSATNFHNAVWSLWRQFPIEPIRNFRRIQRLLGLAQNSDYVLLVCRHGYQLLDGTDIFTEDACLISRIVHSILGAQVIV
jgi:hypothetical protein